MDCKSDMLLLYWSNELNPEEQRQMQEHLARCEACQRELEQLRELAGLYSSMPPELADETPPFDAVGLASSATPPPLQQAAPAARRSAVSWKKMGLAACFVALLALGVWRFGGDFLGLEPNHEDMAGELAALQLAPYWKEHARLLDKVGKALSPPRRSRAFASTKRETSVQRARALARKLQRAKQLHRDARHT